LQIRWRNPSLVRIQSRPFHGECLSYSGFHRVFLRPPRTPASTRGTLKSPDIVSGATAVASAMMSRARVTFPVFHAGRSRRFPDTSNRSL
jgi:hypothetical protein